MSTYVSEFIARMIIFLQYQWVIIHIASDFKSRNHTKSYIQYLSVKLFLIKTRKRKISRKQQKIKPY